MMMVHDHDGDDESSGGCDDGTSGEDGDGCGDDIGGDHWS